MSDTLSLFRDPVPALVRWLPAARPSRPRGWPTDARYRLTCGPRHVERALAAGTGVLWQDDAQVTRVRVDAVEDVTVEVLA